MREGMWKKDRTFSGLRCRDSIDDFYLGLEIVESGDGGTSNRIGFEMLPDQFIRVSIRGIGRKIKKPQLAVETGDERLGLFCDMRGPAVNDQKNLVLGPDHEPPEKLNEHIGIDAAFLLDHEPHVAARRDGRDQAHAVPRSRTPHDRGLALPAPGATRMMIRAHVRGVAEVDLSLFPLRQTFDPRAFLLDPLLHQRFVPFQRTMPRLPPTEAELGEKPPDRNQAQ